MKKFFSFVAILATALVIFVGCNHSGSGLTPESAPAVKPIKIKLGLTDGIAELVAPVDLSVPEGKKLSELFDDQATVDNISTALKLGKTEIAQPDGSKVQRPSFEKDGKTYVLGNELYSEDAKPPIKDDPVFETDKTYYFKATN